MQNRVNPHNVVKMLYEMYSEGAVDTPITADEEELKNRIHGKRIFSRLILIWIKLTFVDTNTTQIFSSNAKTRQNTHLKEKRVSNLMTHIHLKKMKNQRQMKMSLWAVAQKWTKAVKRVVSYQLDELSFCRRHITNNFNSLAKYRSHRWGWQWG